VEACARYCFPHDEQVPDEQPEQPELEAVGRYDPLLLFTRAEKVDMRRLTDEELHSGHVTESSRLEETSSSNCLLHVLQRNS